MLRVVPETVAGPEITLKVTVRDELAVAARVRGAAPNVTGLRAGKVMVCGAVTVTVVADVVLLAEKLVSPE